jgi:transcriptional regulator with XRE-family HTH domain
MEKLALDLRRAMRAKSLTMRDVAERANVSVEYVDDFLEGRVADIEIRSLVDLTFACGYRVVMHHTKKELP